MRRVPIKASKTVSHAGSKKIVTVRVSNGIKAVTGKTTVQTR